MHLENHVVEFCADLAWRKLESYAIILEVPWTNSTFPVQGSLEKVRIGPTFLNLSHALGLHCIYLSIPLKGSFILEVCQYNYSRVDSHATYFGLISSWSVRRDICLSNILSISIGTYYIEIMGFHFSGLFSRRSFCSIVYREQQVKHSV